MMKSVWVGFLVVLVVVVGGLPGEALGQRQAQPAQLMCEVPVEGPRSVRAAFEEFYECTDPLLGPWLKKYPKEVAQLEVLYKAWQAGRMHDLRSHGAAGQWVKKHPVRFSEKSVELTAAQVEGGMPLVSAEPVQVSGAFERLFVDRDHRRLFLTSEEEGLVSISIAERYGFTLEGAVGKGGARDFFVYDSKTAFVEERNPAGGDRDLVVLDISDRARPKEVARVRGALPEMSWRSVFGEEHLEAAPTFDEYVQIRLGRMVTTCGQRWPQVSTHPKNYCRPDGTCYREELRKVTDGEVCMRSVSQLEFNRVAWQEERAVARGAGGMGMRGGEGFGRVGGLPSAAPAPWPLATSPGGAGGAGSLSQMMIHGKMLYVLTGHEGMNRGWLTTIDVSKPRTPRVRHVLALNNGPEALQRQDNLLLVAGRAGVVTASLGEPASPRLLGEFRQVCPANRDPIVVQGSIGYRTIIVERHHPRCTSRLEVLDLSQPHQPVLRTTVPMVRPRGLAVLSRRLFVADESEGVVVFDLGDPVNPERVGTWKLPGVKDLVMSDFDLYAMSADEVRTFYVGPLYRRGVLLSEVYEGIVGMPTVVRHDDKVSSE